MSNVGKRGKISLRVRLRDALVKGTNSTIRHNEIREVIDALTKPQAREDAQPVGWRVRRRSEDPEEWQLRPAGAALDYADGRLWEIQPLYTTPPAPDEIKAAYQRGWGDRESDIIERAERIAPQPDALAVLDRLLTHSGARGTFDAMKHGDAVKDAEALIASSPAPDALRVAVEALENARDALHKHYVDWDGEPEDAVALGRAWAETEQALADLQAEQGAK